MRIFGHKTTLLILGVLAALTVAGCGGGGDNTESTTPTAEEPTALSKGELIEDGDAICAEVNAAVAALGSSETEASSSEGAEKVANLYIGMVERLQDLGAPEGDDGGYANFMEAAEELAKVEGEVKLAAEREDLAALEEATTEAAPALEEFQSQASVFGFEDCSEDPGELPTPAGSGGETEAIPGGEEFEGSEAEEGGVEVEPEYVEPEVEEVTPEEVAPETGGAGGGAVAPEVAPEAGGESGGVGPG